MVGEEHLSAVPFCIPGRRSSNAVVGWINKLTGCRREGGRGRGGNFIRTKRTTRWRENTAREARALTATQSLLRLNLFTIGSFNELHFGPRRISGCYRPSQRAVIMRARCVAPHEGEKITGLSSFIVRMALTPAPPFLPPIDARMF